MTGIRSLEKTLLDNLPFLDHTFLLVTLSLIASSPKVLRILIALGRALARPLSRET
jgi:hypothetical protein